MKYLVLVGEGLADEASEVLGGRTPLEVAKTPNLDKIASRAKLGTAVFVPHSLGALADVACFSVLGFDPLEFYTGIAPLDALALNVPQSEREIAFRCDFVTTTEDTLMDATAGNISPLESRLLIKELAAKFTGPRYRFYPGDSFKNILIVNDTELSDDLDELECLIPTACVGQKIAKSLPKGKGDTVVNELMEGSRSILENHDINRVRIDLMENPANMVWLWGQGKKPKLPPFKERYGISGAVASKTDFVRGIAKAADMGVVLDAAAGLKEKDFTFVYVAAPVEAAGKKDVKTRIKFIEEFDKTVVGPALKAAEKAGDVRICVTTDRLDSVEKKQAQHGPVPFMMAGPGFEPSGAAKFDEKTCAQTAWTIGENQKLIDSFLAK